MGSSFRKHPELFWAKVNKSGPIHKVWGKCWEWIAGDTKGDACRKSYRINCGSIPTGMFVCHHCDNPKCVRPEHLFLGTNNDNRQDSVRKRRHAHGTRHGRAKLSDEQVAEIRRRYRRTSYHNSNKNDLAREFKVHPEYIGLLIRGTYRKEITHERE